jgi:protein phosphatase
VDSGRITADEAAVHPRRSVLMRVLGDVDASPEIDTTIMQTRPGDRWLICSDGLSSFVEDSKMLAVLATISNTEDAANRLVKESLDEGAPDNVTVVLVDIDDSGDSAHFPPITVGSAAAPVVFEAETVRKPMRLPSLLLHPLKTTQPDDSHFEPESDDYLNALIHEDNRRAKRRRTSWLIFVAVVVALAVAAAIIGYQFTQRHYFVGVHEGQVAIFQGVQQDIGPIPLSHVLESTTVGVDQLTPFAQQSVEATIPASSLAEAHQIVDRLANGR